MLDKFDLNCWITLCSNPLATDIINNNLDKIESSISCLENLCKNHKAISIIEKNIFRFNEECWENLCENHQAISIIEKNIDKLNQKCWSNLIQNPNAIHIIDQNFDKLDYQSQYYLCKFPYAIHIIEKNFDKLYENDLYEKNRLNQIRENTFNNNDYGYHYDWNNLSILQLNDWSLHLFFKLDYTKMTENNIIFKKILLNYVLNPIRIKKICEKYNLEFNQYILNYIVNI